MTGKNRQRYGEAYDLNGPEDARRLYAERAADYDSEMIDSHGYCGPLVTAVALAEAVKDRSAWILDAGFGTGLVGEALAKLGFKHVDGLDLVQEMLDVAATKGCYQRLIKANLLDAARLNSGRYDVAVSAGLFTHGHVGPEALDEIMRLVRPGGLIMVMVNAEAFSAQGYQQRLDDMTANGRIHKLSIEDRLIVRGGNIHDKLLTIAHF